MKKLLFIALFSAVGLFAADGATLYKTCIACHGAGADKVPPTSKATYTINTLSKEVIVADLKGYKAGTLNRYNQAQVMKPFLAKLTDADIDALATYITTLKK
ncbi:c-type cytochrome [Helicobacter sp. 23-1045]